VLYLVTGEEYDLAAALNVNEESPAPAAD
jgi:hypothetical protein